MPSFLTTPGRKFSATMSARAARRANTSLPRALFMSSAMLRLFRFSTAKQYDSSLIFGLNRRDASPSGKFSTLTTSAPMSPSTIVQYGPAITLVRSRTRTPSSGSAMSFLSADRGQLRRLDLDEDRIACGEHVLRARADAQRLAGAGQHHVVVPGFAQIGA